MKNKLFKRIQFAMLVVFLFTTNVANALPFTHRHLPPEIKSTCIKMMIAMGGIFLFMILMTIGLSIYNRCFVASQIKDFNLNKDSLRTPRDKDEALLMFITKNRLK